jgi:hypothetical protein
MRSTLTEVIGAMCEGLPPEDRRRERVDAGIRRLATIITERSPNIKYGAAMNKYTMPVLTRLAYTNHRLDIPIDEYVDELHAFIETVMEIDPHGMPHPPVIIVPKECRDPEAEVLAHFANEFVTLMAKLYPKRA